ncbi:hypothetical protein [Paraburkholderia caledonica]|uniref:Uncharacterized protein n=1 Tax=Paraburkholderia caledonica TaxID=134536 RepID=A0AB73INR3_9BURK|nr:hypothetical protein [Paraburkholderia caledonica]
MLAVSALLFLLLPTVSHAEAGELGGVAVFAVTVCSLIWVTLTLLVFLLFRRRLPILKRIGLSALFLFLPVLLLGGEFLKEYAFGEYTSTRTEVTTKSSDVLGVTFPPGSHAEYEQTGGFFSWGANRTLHAIHSPRPVMLGNVSINAMIYIPENCCGQVRVEVSENVNINGWSCGDATFDLTPAGPALRSCFLTAPRRWRGQQYLAGAFVDFSSAMAGTGQAASDPLRSAWR